MTARLRRVSDDTGAILIFAIVIVTTVALVVGTVLTRGDGSLRATVAYRNVAGTTYAADAAAQVTLNDLRTGYWAGTGTKPSGWAYDNNPFDGCFGRDGSGASETPATTLALTNFYPASGGSGPVSAAVECTPENATGQQGTPVAINNANKPGNAILTLGTSSTEPGFQFKTNGSGGAFRVKGGIWSNSTITRDNNGTLESTESIRAHSGCSPLASMSAPVVNCNAATVPDPDYKSEFTVAGLGVPDLKIPPANCSSGSVELDPGYYDDATKLDALTPNGGGSCFIHVKPGTYYFDFHNNSADPLFQSGIAPSKSAGNVWEINSGTIVGGTLTSDTTIPGRCVSPIDSTTADGVQFVMGGDSRIAVDKGAQVELCGTYHADRPPIVVYGQKTGTSTATVLSGPNARTASAVNVDAGTFSGATVANLRDADGDSATGANLAVWARDSSATSTQSATITMSGFATTTPLPKGTVLTGARLKVTHMSSGNANEVTLTPNTGSGLIAYALPGRTTLGTEDVDLTARSGWGALQKSVHDFGFTGATLSFKATLKKNETSRLDAARLELTYVLPDFRGETTAAVPGNTVATPGGQPVISAIGNDTVFYTQGTTYAPKASIYLALNNISESVFRFGVITRSLNIFETASFGYTGAVIELPDNSPGWGTKSTLVQLKVYLCPGGGACTTSTGRLSLIIRAQIWDDDGTPSPNDRQVTVLSWSHRR